MQSRQGLPGVSDGHTTLKEWARELRRDRNPRAERVTAFLAARKAAKALLAA
jgi:hypothetical protein